MWVGMLISVWQTITVSNCTLVQLYYCLCVPVQAAGADMETHTLARYICESTLQEYEFVSDDPSHIAAAGMYLSIRMKGLGPWVRRERGRFL